MAGIYGHVYKIIILGDSGVGKTTLFHRILFEKYLDTSNNTGGTFGMDCFEKTVHNVLGEDVRINLHDSQGMAVDRNHFSTQDTDNLFRRADAVILIYSMEDHDTFDRLPCYAKECVSNIWGSANEIVWALVGNKSDLHCEGIAPERLDDYCDTLRTQLNYTLSAKTGDNVKKAFKEIVEALHERKMKLALNGRKGRESFSLTSHGDSGIKNCCQ